MYQCSTWWPKSSATTPPRARNGPSASVIPRAERPPRASRKTEGRAAANRPAARATATAEPRKAPSMPASFTSPMPRPPGETTAAAKRKSVASEAPSSSSSQRPGLMASVRPNPATTPRATSRFGMMRKRRSTAVIPTRSAHRRSPGTSERWSPKRAAAAAKTRPPAQARSHGEVATTVQRGCSSASSDRRPKVGTSGCQARPTAAPAARHRATRAGPFTRAPPRGPRGA